MDEETSPVKKTVRTRKTIKTAENESEVNTLPIRSTPPTTLTNSFSSLIDQISKSRAEFESQQREVESTKTLWKQEQQDREIERQREQEAYQYNLNLSRKRAEDEFADRKSAWEKELTGKKEQLEKDKQELETLRKQVIEFDSRIEQSVKAAESDTAARITAEFEAEKKLREQEVKSDKEILGLKIEGLSSEVKRQSEEITALKRSLDQAQAHVKDIAVKVIEGGTPKTQLQQE
ncbi:MAG: hypothetical protein CEO21_105 [Microgenomates group bacterium Gr01-1014_80]|nr:MAG: hypothetical protein CEO21_105 [Microgenomates group bacterium Gr01-1014_80]